MKETTKRNGIKWVKISHKSRNVYIVAFGFEGSFKAFKVQEGPKNWAEIASKNWLNEQ